jgi:hypothetical protein
MTYGGIKIKVSTAILVAVLVLLGLAPVVLAQATVTLNVMPAPPNTIDNSGTGVETFNWTIQYDSTPVRYFFQVWDSTDTPITTHNNITQFPPAEIIVSVGTVTTFANRIEVTNLPAPPNTVTGQCKWHVPKGYPTAGFCRGHVEYYSTATPGTYEAQATQTFYVAQATGRLEIFKYNDINQNGVHDAGEPGLQNWHFAVTGPEPISADTDANGYIVRDPVLAGTYTVTETLKAGWTCSDPGSGLTDTVTVPAGGTGSIDFGNYQVGSLQIFKYNDINENGQHDAGEPGIPNWHFEVTGPESFSDDTDASGYINRSPITPGSYQVTETLQAGWTCSDPGPGLMKTVTVPPGGSGNVVFGNYPPPTKLIIFKYNDINKNGVLDGEPGLPGWHFSISGPDSFEDDTDADGFIIRNVSAGDYQVTETLVTNWTCSDPGGTLMKTVTVPDGGTGRVDFGNYATPPTPTTTQWGMIVLVVLFAGSMAWMVRRRINARLS